MSLEAQDAAAAAVAKTPNRVTLDSLNAKIVATEYVRPISAPALTVCIATTANGFSLVGKSACADPANYNEALGQEIALRDCIEQMWALEGYLLREKLSSV